MSFSFSNIIYLQKMKRECGMDAGERFYRKDRSNVLVRKREQPRFLGKLWWPFRVTGFLKRRFLCFETGANPRRLIPPVWRPSPLWSEESWFRGRIFGSGAWSPCRSAAPKSGFRRRDGSFSWWGCLRLWYPLRHLLCRMIGYGKFVHTFIVYHGLAAVGKFF